MTTADRDEFYIRLALIRAVNKAWSEIDQLKRELEMVKKGKQAEPNDLQRACRMVGWAYLGEKTGISRATLFRAAAATDAKCPEMTLAKIALAIREHDVPILEVVQELFGWDVTVAANWVARWKEAKNG